MTYIFSSETEWLSHESLPILWLNDPAWKRTMWTFKKNPLLCSTEKQHGFGMRVSKLGPVYGRVCIFLELCTQFTSRRWYKHTYNTDLQIFSMTNTVINLWSFGLQDKILALCASRTCSQSHTVGSGCQAYLVSSLLKNTTVEG